MSFLDKLNNLLGQKSARPPVPPPLPPQGVPKPYTGPAPPPIPQSDSAEKEWFAEDPALRRLEKALGGSDAVANALEEGNAARMEKARMFYDDGALLIMEGLFEDRRNSLCNGLENLLIADELARQSDPNALGPWKLFHAVMRHTLEGEELEKHIFIQQMAGRNNPEILRFMEQIDEIGSLEYIHRALEPVLQTLEAKRKQPEAENVREAFRLNDEAMKRLEEGNYRDALEQLLAAISLSPKQAKLHHNIAMAFCFLNDFDEATKHMEIALSLAPDWQELREHVFDTYFMNARSHLGEEDWLTGIELCRKAILICPAHQDATNIFDAMWVSYEKPGCYEPVLAACKEIVAKCPQWNYARYRLGRMLQESKRPEEAMPILREAVQREPTNPLCREWLIYAYWGVRDHGAALEQLCLLETIAPGQAREFKQRFREVCIATLRKLKETDPDKAKEFQMKLGPGLIDPDESCNN